LLLFDLVENLFFKRVFSIVDYFRLRRYGLFSISTPLQTKKFSISSFFHIFAFALGFYLVVNPEYAALSAQLPDKASDACLYCIAGK